MVKVKICGVRDRTGVDACLAARPDLVGLNFVPGRARAVDLTTGAHLARDLEGLLVVGVFLDAPIDEILRTVDAVGLVAVQLHGTAPPAQSALLRARGLTVLRALRVTGASLEAEVEAHRPVADYLLFDAPSPGSGVRVAEGALDRLDLSRAFVAGGLTPDNVGAVVRRHHPAGVDVASGVEIDGRMSPARVAAFCAAARAPQQVHS